jgi:CheY-like chemotaxis protein
MKLDYTILWIDNDPEIITVKCPEIKKYLDEQWFNLDLVFEKSDQNLFRILENKDVNLILIDYNLSQKKKGDEIIEDLRQKEIFTDVVFYSAQDSFVKETKPHLDGVFYSPIGNLVDKTKTVINVTLKKNQDLNNIRGLFIAETIDLTMQIEDLISKILCLNVEQLTFFVHQIIRDEFFNDVSKYKIVRRFFADAILVIDEKIKSASAEEQKELNSLKERIRNTDEEFGHFRKEVIELRNALAHARRSESNRRNLFTYNRDKNCIKIEIFNEARCIEIREQFVKYSGQIAKISLLVDDIKQAQLYRVFGTN